MIVEWAYAISGSFVRAEEDAGTPKGTLDVAKIRVRGEETAQCGEACLYRGSSVVVYLPCGGLGLVGVNDVAACLVYLLVVLACTFPVFAGSVK